LSLRPISSTVAGDAQLRSIRVRDCGWPLAVDALMTDEGRKPVVDFSYFYGLLTLLIDRAAFAIFGRTPQTVVGLYGVCALAIAIGAVRTMAAMKLRVLPSLYLVVCAALVTIPRGFPSPAHALEAAFLMNALADHAAGRLGRALALVVLAVFVKPSLGYVYGLMLVVLILTGWPSGASRWRRLLPATGVGAILTLGLTALLRLAFGDPDPASLRRHGGLSRGRVRLLPRHGQGFWLPEEPTLAYYRDTIPGFWLASTIVLLVSAVRLLPRFRELGANLTITLRSSISPSCACCLGTGGRGFTTPTSCSSERRWHSIAGRDGRGGLLALAFDRPRCERASRRDARQLHGVVRSEPSQATPGSSPAERGRGMEGAARKAERAGADADGLPAPAGPRTGRPALVVPDSNHDEREGDGPRADRRSPAPSGLFHRTGTTTI